MDVSFHGANCVSITTRGARFIFDDNLEAIGGNNAIKTGDVALFTANPHVSPKNETKLTIDGPGEYEIGDISVQGIAARAHTDTQDQNTATIYKLTGDDVRLLIVGHIYPELGGAQLEQIGMVDVMLVPVGGNGYTLDTEGALSLIKKIEPKLVVPTHYDDSKLKFEVPQQPLDEVIKGLAMEPRESTAKLHLKPTDFAVDVTQLQVLEKQ